MIIDIRPGVADKDRVLTDDDFPQVPMTVIEQDKSVIQHGEGRGILEMSVDNLKIILRFDSGSQLYTSGQRYMLVPESLYQEKMKIDSRDVLQSIKKREMLKRYSPAQNILQGPYIGMDRYQEVMQDVSVLKNRVISRQITDPPVVKNSARLRVKLTMMRMK